MSAAMSLNHEQRLTLFYRAQDANPSLDMFSFLHGLEACEAALMNEAKDAARYRFLFEERVWCAEPLWPLVEYFRDGRGSKSDVDAAIDAALETEAPAEACFCDKQGIGEPGVSCGDCPTRDYQEPSMK